MYSIVADLCRSIERRSYMSFKDFSTAQGKTSKAAPDTKPAADGKTAAQTKAAADPKPTVKS